MLSENTTHKIFIASIFPITNGEYIPILYIKGMILPSIFWNMVPVCGNISVSIL